MSQTEYELYLKTLAERRAPAVAEAERLVAEDRFDEAETAIRRADDSIYGNVEIAALFRRALEQAGPERARRRALFDRAVTWEYRCYPEPHTAIEADQYAAGQAKAYSELVKILGFDPAEGV